MPTRINKYLADNGHCSRREADRLVEAGRVTINGRSAQPGDQVDGRDQVAVDGRSLRRKHGFVYLMLNKPPGMISTADPNSDNNVVSHVQAPVRVYPVGRLDVASSGLLLLTDDGRLTERLTHPRYGHEKEYLVRLVEPISDQDLHRLSSGIELDGQRTRPAKVRRQDERTFRITLCEGRHRQIRRMAEALGHEVKSLKRTRLASLRLGDLKPGQYRRLTADERRGLMADCDLEELS